LLSHLAKSHDVTLLYWIDDPQDLNHTPFLRSLCRGRVIPVRLNRPFAFSRAVFSLLSGNSFTEGFYRARAFQKELDSLLCGPPFDVVYVYSSAVAPYATSINARTKIVDFVDVDSIKWRQLADVSRFPLSVLYRLEHKRLSKLEIAISRWATRSVFISQAEADLFKATGGEGSIECLANGTDLEVRRLPLGKIHYSLTNGHRDKAGEKLIFVGTMDYSPNIDAARYFAEEIFPLVRQQFPYATFEIVGRRPSRTVRRLTEIEGVRVVGEVDDVRAYLVQADISVAPMRIARGVQNKVLEAMAVGVPVVATPQAIEGIEVQDGEEVLVASNPRDFARHIVQILNDTELQKSLTKKAWSKMNQCYNWEIIGAKLDRLLARQRVSDKLAMQKEDFNRESLMTFENTRL